MLEQERVRSDCLWSCPVELLMGVFKGWDFCYLCEQFSQWLTNLVVGEGGSFPTSHQNFQCCNFCLLSLILGSCRAEMTLPPPLLNLPIRSLNTEKLCPPPPNTEGTHALSLSVHWIYCSTLTTLESLHQILSMYVTGIC